MHIKLLLKNREKHYGFNCNLEIKYLIYSIITIFINYIYIYIKQIYLSIIHKHLNFK